MLFTSTGGGLRESFVVLATLAVLLKTKLNPLWLIIVGAVAGIAGLIG